MDDETQIEEELVEEPTEEVLEEESEAIDETELDTERQAREKAEALAESFKVRAEKAEKELKRSVQKDKPDLSSKDTIAIINAKVHEDDVDEIVELAKFKKVSVAEALKLPLTKTILAERAEERETAEVTTTGRTRSSAARVSGDSLLSKAQKTGEIPESASDLDAMLNARYAK